MKKISLIATSLLLGASFLVSPITPAHAASSDIVMDSENYLLPLLKRILKVIQLVLLVLYQPLQ